MVCAGLQRNERAEPPKAGQFQHGSQGPIVGAWKMAAVGTSLPHSRAISAKSKSADSTLPPMSKKFSSIPMEGRCSTRCQIGIRASTIAEAVAEPVLRSDLDESNRVMESVCARVSMIRSWGAGH